MATDSTRKKAIAGLVTVLAAVTAGSDYFYTLSGDLTVSSTFELDSVRIENPSPVTLRVRDGVERHKRDFQDTTAGSTAELQLVIDVLVKHRSGDGPNLVNEMQNVIHDVLLAVGKDRSLSASVNDAFVSEVEEPIYDMDQNLAAVTIRVACEYDYLSGATT